MGMPQNRVWKARPLCFFRSFWKARNSVAFRDEVLSLQKAKSFFVYLLWLATKLTIVDSLSTIVQFNDWVGSR